MKQIALVVVALALSLCMFGCANDAQNSGTSPYIEKNKEIVEKQKADREAAEKAEAAKESKETPKVEDAPKTEEAPKPESTPEPAEPAATKSQQNALKKAKDYLDYTAFSYTGLIEQLEYEKFSTEDATYGADKCGADWNEQAAKKAADYLDYTSFSRDGLIEQLEYEGFTAEQATYGVDSVGL